MYATAQRVDSGAVNCALYESVDCTVLIKRSDESPSPNKGVLSWLDIEYPRGTPRATIVAALKSFHFAVNGTPTSDVEAIDGDIRLRFHAHPPATAQEKANYAGLERRLLDLPL
jgi:hypothetical protein